MAASLSRHSTVTPGTLQQVQRGQLKHPLRSTFPGSQTSWAVPVVTLAISDDLEEAATKDVTKSLIKEVQVAVMRLS